MDEIKLVLPLDLQFFAEGDPVDNPPQTKETEVPPTDDGKKFTQEDLNRINIKGKEAELKRILKATGFESEEKLLEHLGKTKDYDDKVAKIVEYEQRERKNSYVSEIRKNNVADEYLEVVYTANIPTENEKVEDYNKRIATYLENHKALLKVDNANKVVNSNFGYTGNSYQGSGILDLKDALNTRKK